MASQRNEDDTHFADEETEAQAVCDPVLYLEAPDQATC